MKKKIAIILAIVFILTLSVVFCSCNDNAVYDKNYNSHSDRMIALEEGNYGTGYYSIFYDKETNIMYLFVKAGYSGCLTIMLDENGKPLLYEKETE